LERPGRLGAGPFRSRTGRFPIRPRAADVELPLLARQLAVGDFAGTLPQRLEAEEPEADTVAATGGQGLAVAASGQRVVTRDENDGTERASTGPGRGLWTIPPAYAVLSAAGRDREILLNKIISRVSEESEARPCRSS